MVTDPHPTDPADPSPADAEVEPADPVDLVGVVRGDGLVRVDLWATVVFAVTAVGAAVWSALVAPAMVVDLALFVAGCAAFLWAYARAVGRSRDEVISMAGLFFLAEGVAPRSVAWALRLLLAIQVVVALGTAAARPFSSLAFGILAPMFGLALLAVWGAARGTFPAHPVRPSPNPE
jgi:hypothetical protein